MNIIEQLLTSTFFYSVIRVSVPLLLPALGALVTNRAGVPNIGLEGIMLMSAFFGVVGSAFSGSAMVGLLAAIFMGIVMSLFLAYFTLKLKTNVILGGIALNLFSSSLTVFLLYILTGDKGTSASLASKTLPSIRLPIIEDIPFIGAVLSNHNVLVYVTFVIVVLVYILLQKTPLGQHIKAVGENENAAASVGINVNRTRIISFIICGVVCGIAGAFLSMGYVSWFSRDMTSGRGWIALAAEAMGRNTMVGTVLSSMLFGFASALANILQLQGLPTELVTILPNIITVVALVSYSVMKSKGGRKYE
ncbi:ABC transporter permease [Proteiniclasticum sp. SCR006]|uniref:ABC transporter permease n=1 Tax=Proteiniclasticum aestuarii TaxID=2817862 RepID=A0A939HAX8_9CLOT|nr:ABC transporter permease [Proteiniclasticum aestuarii]MBO1265113.1 ABC transporter permease [Proteiniclasticum aestuarii]